MDVKDDNYNPEYRTWLDYELDTGVKPKKKSILEIALGTAVTLETTDMKFIDSKSNGPSPADLGEHLPIPEEAVTVVSVEADKVEEV